MGIQLGPNRYGKAETRLVRIGRTGARHEINDLNVSVALAGDFADTHLTGDNANVLPTDTQKNTVFAFAKEHGIGEIEEFGLLLARHFVDSQVPIRRSRVTIEQYFWDRLGGSHGGEPSDASDGGEPSDGSDDGPAPHSFRRCGPEVRTAAVTYDGSGAWVVSGLKDLVVLNSTDSEFRGYPKDRYTTLPETRDRILATVVNAQWRHCAADGDWGKSYAQVRRHLLDAFAHTYSLSLQQTLYAMGRQVVANRPEIAEVRLSLPNKHHFLVDLSGFDLTNDDEVYFAADRPYGLIEGTVLRDDAPAAGPAWNEL